MNVIILLYLPSDPRLLSLCFLGKTATAVKLPFLWTGYRNQAERTHGSITDFRFQLMSVPMDPSRVESATPLHSCFISLFSSLSLSARTKTFTRSQFACQLLFFSQISFLSHLNPFPSGHHLNHSSHFHINKFSDRVSTHILLDLFAAGATVSHSLLICMFST